MNLDFTTYIRSLKQDACIYHQLMKEFLKSSHSYEQINYQIYSVCYKSIPFGKIIFLILFRFKFNAQKKKYINSCCLILFSIK